MLNIPRFAMPAILLALCAARSFAQEPAGAWQSPTQITLPAAALVGADLYLSISVAADGKFRGRWDQYGCQSTGERKGPASIPCTVAGNGGSASGILDAGGRGIIELESLGRTNLSWRTSAGELSIELYKFWLSNDQYLLYRSRLLPAKAAAPASAAPSAAGSATTFFREAQKDTEAFKQRYLGKQVMLEGRRGNVIQTNPGVAIHIADGFTSNALILSFRDNSQVQSLKEGDLFRFRCTVIDAYYANIFFNDCSVLP